MQGRGSSTESYDSYGDEVYHNEGDTIRLGCELGFVNGFGKEFMGAECKCDDNGNCSFEKNFTEWTCISAETQQAMPVWTGAVFNFIKDVQAQGQKSSLVSV